MSKDDAKKQMKAMKAKAKKARAEGKTELAASFRSGARRLQRKIKLAAPKGGAKVEGEGAPAAAAT